MSNLGQTTPPGTSTSQIVFATPDNWNLGPLTTTFSLPSFCLDVILSGSDDQLPTKAVRGYQCTTNLGSSDCYLMEYVRCWPPVDPLVPTQPGFDLGGGVFYSPGLICPSGYMEGCRLEPTATPSSSAGSFTKTSSVIENWQFQFDVERYETAIGCCPM